MRAFGKTFEAMREERMRSGSRHSTTRPSLRVVDRHPQVRLDVFALQVLQQLDRLDAVGLERLVGHAEELGRAPRRSPAILTWNSSISTCSMSMAFLRAWREASSNSPAESTASAIR